MRLQLAYPAPLSGGLGGMHRTQIKKRKKEKQKQIDRLLFLSSLFSLSVLLFHRCLLLDLTHDLWRQMWVGTATPEIN
jgi:hypothetical protein